jgi:hypothetical protein
MEGRKDIKDIKDIKDNGRVYSYGVMGVIDLRLNWRAYGGISNAPPRNAIGVEMDIWPPFLPPFLPDVMFHPSFYANFHLPAR